MKTQSRNLAQVVRNTELARPLVELVVANAAWGILGALKEHEITLGEAEDRLFNLEVYQAARKRKLNRNLIEFLEWGMQLEDVMELAPENIDEDYREMTRLLHRVLFKSRGRARSGRNQAVSLHSRTGA